MTTTEANILKTVKTLKGISNDSKDDVLNALIENCTSLVCDYISEPQVPTQLEYVVINIVREQLTRFDDEGVDSYSIGGNSYKYKDNGLLHGYEEVLNRYLKRKKRVGLGVYVW